MSTIKQFLAESADPDFEAMSHKDRKAWISRRLQNGMANSLSPDRERQLKKAQEVHKRLSGSYS